MYLLVHHVDTITYNQNFLCVQKAVKRIGEQKIFLFSDKPDVATPCCSFFASFFSSCQLQIWFQLLIYNFNTVCFQTWLSNISKYFVWTIQILSKNAKNHFGKTYIKSCFKINFEIYKKISFRIKILISGWWWPTSHASVHTVQAWLIMTWPAARKKVHMITEAEIPPILECCTTTSDPWPQLRGDSKT